MLQGSFRPQFIISGGQTGVDRGALDAAMILGNPHRGNCPRGRRAEDGVIPACYQLTECESENYGERTRANAEEGEATLVVIGGSGAGEGTLLTIELARELGKPLLVLETQGRLVPDEIQVAEVRAWLEQNIAEVLNVAGSRASEAPEGNSFVRELLVRALG